MKKILAIAVATAISAPAMADLTIGGSADYMIMNNDGVVESNIETNLDFTAKVEGDNGLYAKAYLQIESWDAGATTAAAPAEGGMDIDDNYLEIGNGTASVTMGAFAVKTAFNAGNDDFQVDGNDYAAKTLWLANDVQDLAVTVTPVAGLTVQYATTVDSGDSDSYQVYASYDAGVVAVAAEYEDTGDDAETGYAVNVSTTAIEGVGLNVSYAKNDAGASSSNVQANWNGFQLNLQNDDSATNVNESSYYGSYTFASLAGLQGLSLTVGAGADKAAEKAGAYVVYGF